MRKENPARFSSAVGEAWMHCEFKIKYCHEIFRDVVCREGLRTLLLEVAYNHEIPIGELGFADDHVHFMADIGNYSRPEVAKFLRGYVGKKFFEYFPDIKQKYFWGSGLWNPLSCINSHPRLSVISLSHRSPSRYNAARYTLSDISS